MMKRLSGDIRRTMGLTSQAEGRKIEVAKVPKWWNLVDTPS